MTDNSNEARGARATEINDEILDQAAGGAGSGGGTGKVSMNDFHFVMRNSAAETPGQDNRLQKRGSFDIS